MNKKITVCMIALLTITVFMTGCHQREKQIDSLLQDLLSRDFGTQKKARQGLVKIGTPAVPYLIDTLDNDSFVVIMGPGKALVEIGLPAVPFLIQALDRKEMKIRVFSAYVLGEIGDKKAADRLLQLVESDEHIDVRAQAADSLAKLEDNRAVGPIIDLLKEKSEDVRMVAADALGNIGDEMAVLPLCEALHDDQWGVREVSATALGEIGDDRAVDALIQALQDEMDEVSVKAAAALTNIGLKSGSRKALIAVILHIQQLLEETTYDSGELVKKTIPELAGIINLLGKKLSGR